MYYQIHGVRLRKGSKLLRHWLEAVKGERVSHCYLMLDDGDIQWWYGITTKGVEMLKFSDYMGEITAMQTSKQVVINQLQLHDILIRIDVYAKSQSVTHPIDFIRYGVLHLLGKRYKGRNLCTGFVQAVLGLDVTHSTPYELIQQVNELTQASPKRSVLGA